MTDFAVAWVPESSETPKTLTDALNLGCRVVDMDLSLNNATEVRSCLTIGAPNHGDYAGRYVIVQ